MEISVDTYEKLGVFYLGREYDLKSKELQDELVLYDSKDLTTHAVCVGMTGSGKTGLCVSLLEEAILDGIPAIVIDPKGDIPNLCLTFPGLSGPEFRPWINEDDARRKGLSPDEYAQKQADLWRNGLGSWGEGPDRVKRLTDAADISIYTPGSEAGIPVSILDSLSPPPAAVMEDGDLLRERISTTATSLLGLLGMTVDPLRSREHILLSNLFEKAWIDGKTVDLSALINGIQNPPFEKVGVMDLDSFYPAGDRFELAMSLNNLLASPGFETWLQGAPLDIDSMLYDDDGKPRIAIFSIAHLSDAERMFFVSLLLNQTLGWMRTRPGTTSLRALLYMDEIFGYMPPVANPPSKQPMLTLLKQARAYGLGLVLATQNPVDLDYKGLSNTGTWFIGRLQTERDKMRVLEGLEGAAAGGSFDRGDMEKVIAGLGARVFLMHNVHEDAPVVFHTRWAMSYLRGPVTRSQIKELMKGRAPADTKSTATGEAAPDTATGKSRAPAKSSDGPPVLPPGVKQTFLVQSRGGDSLTYLPRILGTAKVHFLDKKKGEEHIRDIAYMSHLKDGAVALDWYDAAAVDVSTDDLDSKPMPGASFGDLPAVASRARSYKSWEKEFADKLYRSERLELFQHKTLGLISNPGESERDFRIRVGDAMKEMRDEEIEAMREKFAKRIERAEERVRKAEQKVEREEGQAQSQKMSTVVNIGATLLTAFMGRKKMSRSTLGRATTTIRGVGRQSKEAEDIRRAEDDLEVARQKHSELEEQLQTEIEDLQDKLDPELAELESASLKPRRTDINVRHVGLVWAPHRKAADGSLEPVWK